MIYIDETLQQDVVDSLNCQITGHHTTSDNSIDKLQMSHPPIDFSMLRPYPGAFSWTIVCFPEERKRKGNRNVNKNKLKNNGKMSTCIRRG